MKVQFFIACISICICLSCADDPTTTDASATRTTMTPKSPVKGQKKVYKAPLHPAAAQQLEKKATPVLDIQGAYVGMFEAEVYDEEKDYTSSNKINISIDQLDNGHIKGHSVVAGNQRPFSGTYNIDKAGDYIIEVKEPGDDRYDGAFEFVAYPKEKMIEGRWVANNEKLAVSARHFNLKQKKFQYDASLQIADKEFAQLVSSQHDTDSKGEFLTADAYKFNASNELLSKEAIENMYKGDLEIMRNAIYARHGYSFKNRKMRFFFDNYVDWYMPVSTDIRAKLTTLEKTNIDLLKRYEEHADRYYDNFGR